MRENGPKAENDKTETGHYRQKNKRRDIEKWDQTESPEIPDRGRYHKCPASLRWIIIIIMVHFCIALFFIRKELTALGRAVIFEAGCQWTLLSAQTTRLVTLPTIY